MSRLSKMLARLRPERYHYLLVALHEDGRTEVQNVHALCGATATGLTEAQKWVLSDVTVRAVTVYVYTVGIASSLETKFLCRVVRENKNGNNYFRQWNEGDTTVLTNLTPLHF